MLAGPRLSREEPAVLWALADLVGATDALEMHRMNLAVDRDSKSPSAVAAEFLRAGPLELERESVGEP